MARKRLIHPLAKLSEESPLPIYLIDDQRQILSCNRAALDWLGLSAEQLIGQRCDYTAQETASVEVMAACALSPPPQAFHGELCTSHVTWRRAGGEPERRPATFAPLRAEEPAAVIAILGEITHRDSILTSPSELAQADQLHQRLQQAMLRMRTRFRLDRLVGESPAIRRVREQVAAAIATRARVVIIGPPGSGREHVARTIVYADKPDLERVVVSQDCQALDRESLDASVESLSRRTKAPSVELFWILLDIDQLDPQMQVELAGRLKSTSLRAQVIATARRPLVQLAALGEFDAELAFVLSTLSIEMPALRDRREDIPLLVQRMVEEHNAAAGKQLAGFSPSALERLVSLPWAGNVEELAGVIREACQNVSTVWIGEGDLPARVRAVVSAGMRPRREEESIELDSFLLEVERELMERAMRKTKGNKTQAARLLGISRARLLRRLEQFGLITREETAIDFQPEIDDHEKTRHAEGQFAKEE